MGGAILFLVGTERRRPGLRRAAQVTALTSVAFAVVSLILGPLLDSRIRAADAYQFQHRGGASLVYGATLTAAAVVGAVLLVRRPAHPVGWLFAALATAIATSGLSDSYALYGLVVRPGSQGATAAAVIANSTFIVVFALVALVCSLTPDGHHLSHRWRRISQVMGAASGLWVGLRLVSPEPLEAPFGDVENPWAFTSVNPSAVRWVLAVVSLVSILFAPVSLVVRYRRADDDVRRQLRWIVVAAVPIPALLVVTFVSALTGNDVLLSLATGGVVMLIPIGAALSVTRYHLYDVDRILSRAITYLAVTGLVVGTYVAVVFVVAYAVDQSADQSPAATTAATLAAVAAARPAYEAIRNVLDRHFQRRRYEAVRQVQAFVADPSGSRDVESVLRRAFADPSLRVAYPDESGARWVTEAGHETTIGEDTIKVTRGGRTVAAVTTGSEDPEIVRAVLDEAGPELDNARLRAAVALQLEEVRASRERIAEAQVHERRRVERDLHDGAQQRLLGVAAQMQAALLNGSQERLRAGLELGVRESRIAVSELRALANGLHPAVLEDGGLPAALEDLSSRLPVSVSFSGPKRRHPPMLEATLWFVTCEAVTNATKHAAATRVVVHLEESGGRLRVMIEDDGCGGADATGTGLRGLADRVEAVGGHLTIASPPGGGTHVEAVVPCGS